MDQTPPPLPQQASPGWWSRHWKWAVPVCVITSVGIAAGFGFLLFTSIFGFMKSSEPYKVAMSRALASSEVRTALGTPVEQRMMISGNMSTTGTEEHASFTIPISGPKGKANIYVEAHRTAGKWTYKTMEIGIPEQPARIDLKT